MSYGWHYWPHDNCRSSCGLAGMINLGATCYMASCMQQLYMMPEARTSILKVQVCRSLRCFAINSFWSEWVEQGQIRWTLFKKLITNSILFLSQPTGDKKLDTSLKEMQKMFCFLMVNI